MKHLILYIIILASGANCYTQIDHSPDKIILPKIGIWSPESTPIAHTRCANNFSDSLVQVIDSAKLITHFSTPITSIDSIDLKLSSDSLIIDSSGIYCLNFSNSIDWRLDFMNRPVYANECFELENKSEFQLNEALKKFAGSNQEYYFVRDGEETWLVISNRIITMLGNSMEGIDHIYYLKKGKTVDTKK